MSAKSKHSITVTFYTIPTGYESGCNNRTGKGLWTLWRTVRFLEVRECFVGLSPLPMIDTAYRTEIAAVCNVQDNGIDCRGSSYCTV